MSGTPDIHGLARQQAVLEERMKTMQAEYQTDIGRLAEDMARRETRQLGYTVGAVGVGVAIIAAVIALAALFLASRPVVQMPAPAPAAPVHQPEPLAPLPDAGAVEPPVPARPQPDG